MPPARVTPVLSPTAGVAAAQGSMAVAPNNDINGGMSDSSVSSGSQHTGNGQLSVSGKLFAQTQAQAQGVVDSAEGTASRSSSSPALLQNVRQPPAPIALYRNTTTVSMRPPTMMPPLFTTVVGINNNPTTAAMLYPALFNPAAYYQQAQQQLRANAHFQLTQIALANNNNTGGGGGQFPTQGQLYTGENNPQAQYPYHQHLMVRPSVVANSLSSSGVLNMASNNGSSSGQNNTAVALLAAMSSNGGGVPGGMVGTGAASGSISHTGPTLLQNGNGVPHLSQHAQQQHQQEQHIQALWAQLLATRAQQNAVRAATAAHAAAALNAARWQNNGSCDSTIVSSVASPRMDVDATLVCRRAV